MIRLILPALMLVLTAATSDAFSRSEPKSALPLASMTPVCPSDKPEPRRALVKFVTSPGLAGFRAEVGLTVSDTAAIRTLVDSTDSVACQHLASEIVLDTLVPREWSFYKLGDLYFVATADTSSHLLETDPLIVFSGSLAFIKVIGM